MRWLARLILAILARLPDKTLSGLARLLFSRSWRAFEEATEEPRKAQEARLRLIVDRARHTEFGKAHDFAAIRTIEDYQSRVPIRGYDELAPYLERMAAGEQNVLIPDSPTFFAQTSGTTGKAKLIPVTPVYLAEFRTPRRVWIRQVMQAFPGLLRGKILTMHSPRVEGRTAGGVPYGSITVAMSGKTDAGEMPASVFDVDPIPRRVFLLEDFHKKYRVVLRIAAQEDIRLAATVNPSTLVLLAEKLDEHADAIAEELERGGLEGLDDIAEPLHTELQAVLRKNEAAAARIRRARMERGVVRPVDVWPNMVGLISWKGGSAPFYLEQLDKWFPGLAIMDYGYLATEGGFTVVMSPEGSKGVVSVLGHFLEFVPEDVRAEGGSEPALGAWDLEIGQRYRVIVTGSHGLYRYDINDVVECVGRYRNTAEIVFVHKGGNMISYTGEKIGERHVVEAFTSASGSSGVALAGFCVSVEPAQPPRYRFGVEPRDALDGAAKAELLRAAERGLREANVEYAAKRDSLRLGPPRLDILEAGAFERYRAQKVAAGAPDSHVKPPHLVSDPAQLDALGVVETFEAGL